MSGEGLFELVKNDEFVVGRAGRIDLPAIGGPNLDVDDPLPWWALADQVGDVASKCVIETKVAVRRPFDQGRDEGLHSNRARSTGRILGGLLHLGGDKKADAGHEAEDDQGRSNQKLSG
ncbi:hypothetical protein [Rhizobium rhizophilum]|uniref:hypothetical protein n=1 Tax=Rhizobium rhizophilum TaxID=1850373 RepID=UPI001F254282|nr:hypothetical protein [Rhizobium rhizophilum]